MKIEGEDTGIKSDHAVCALTLSHEPTLEERIDCEQPGAENQDEERGEPVCVRRGAVEVFGLREDVGEVDAVIGNAEVRHRHVDKENQRGEARCDSERKQDTSAELDKRDGESGHMRSGQAEAREEFGDLVEMRELTPAVLRKLETPVEANGEEERASQAIECRGNCIVGVHERVHRFPFN